MIKGFRRRLSGGLLALAVGGCAMYHAAPLAPAADGTLSGPALDALIAPAADFHHPLLKPVIIDPAQPLTGDALATLAVLANPDLKAARAKARVSSAQVFQTGLLPDPSVNLSYDFRLSGPDPMNGWAGALAYELTALRDRGLMLKGAKAADAQVRLDLAWQEWQTGEQAKLLGARIAGLDAVTRYAVDTKTSTDKALSRVLDAAARGDLKSDDVETRRLAVIDASDRLSQAQKDLGAARLDLNKLLGLPPETRLRIAIPLTATVPSASANALFQESMDRRLDLKALRAGYDSQDANVRKAIRDQFPSFQLTVNRAQDTANNQTIGPAVNFTLPLWNRNQGGVRIAEATREQLRAEYAARVFAARADIADLIEGLALAARQRQVNAAQIDPLQRSTDAAVASGARGDLSDAAVETFRQTLRDKQASLAALDQAIAEQTISLELATGGPLP